MTMTISKEVVSEIVGDQAVLLDLRSGKYYQLNRTGTMIWQGIEQGHGVDAVCKSLVMAFRQPEPEVRGDVARLITELTSRGLIEMASS